jgi:hypothetical protein
MAKMIVVKESTFNRLFQHTMDKLKAERFASTDGTARFANSEIGRLHAAFQYELCGLKTALENE